MQTIIDAVFGVFTEIGDWFVTAIQSMIPIFYSTEGGLTILGVLALCALGFSIIMLLINKVLDFFRWQ